MAGTVVIKATITKIKPTGIPAKNIGAVKPEVKIKTLEIKDFTLYYI